MITLMQNRLFRFSYVKYKMNQKAKHIIYIFFLHSLLHACFHCDIFFPALTVACLFSPCDVESKCLDVAYKLTIA